MGGWLSLNAEVLLRLHDSVPAVVLPVTIDGDSGGQWVFGIDEPLRQREAIERRILWKRRQNCRNAGLNLVGLIPIVSSGENERVARLLHLGHDHGRRDLLDEIVFLRLQTLQFAVRRPER